MVVATGPGRMNLTIMRGKLRYKCIDDCEWKVTKSGGDSV